MDFVEFETGWIFERESVLMSSIEQEEVVESLRKDLKAWRDKSCGFGIFLVDLLRFEASMFGFFFFSDFGSLGCGEEKNLGFLRDLILIFGDFGFFSSDSSLMIIIVLFGF